MVPSESPLVTRHSSSSGTEAPRSRRPRPQVQVLSAGPQEPPRRCLQINVSGGETHEATLFIPQGVRDQGV